MEDYQAITEVPFVASTTGDGWLSLLIESRRSRERLREAAHKQLGIERFDPISFGRGGRVTLEPSYVLPFSSLAGTTTRVIADRFKHDLLKHHVLVLHSAEREIYGHVCKLLQQQQARILKMDIPLAGRVNRFLSELTVEDSAVNRLAQQLRQRLSELSREERAFHRLPAELVRIEDDEALLTVWNEDASREELRSIDTSMLADIGVQGEGDPLLLYEMEYAPGLRISSVMPGVVTERAPVPKGLDEESLRREETPLPSVAELEAREREISARRSGHTNDGPGRRGRAR